MHTPGKPSAAWFLDGIRKKKGWQARGVKIGLAIARHR
jgi:hypothetical protein